MKVVVGLCCALMLVGVSHAEKGPKRELDRDREAEFNACFRRAYDASLRGDFSTAQKWIEEGEEIKPGTPLLANFRGGILFDQGRYDEAAVWFRDALKHDPLYYPPRINLADIEFRLKRYQKARSAYRVVLLEQPSAETLLYRVFLTYLMEGNDQAAQKALAAIPFPGDTPAHYFAYGAWCFAHGKNAEALGWIEPGMSIFGYERSVTFAEPLVFLGWLKKGFRPPNVPMANPPESTGAK